MDEVLRKCLTKRVIWLMLLDISRQDGENHDQQRTIRSTGASRVDVRQQHPAKSERQLCKERGGVYGELQGVGYRCFSPSAFKQEEWKMALNKQQRKAMQAGLELEAEQKKNAKENFCYACNGTGRYDTFHSPKCSACDGTGKIKTEK